MLTTVFTTRYWRKSGKCRMSLARWFACVLFLVAPVFAMAQSASVQSVKLELTEEGYQLNADLELALTAAMQDAVRKGVPLYFIAEFQLTRGRWYWLDQAVVSANRDRRVSYAPLTDQYRVVTSGVSQNVASFDDVRRLLSRIRSWTVAEKGQLRVGEKYEAALRFRLDTSQLPKPFQLNVLGSREWSLSSDWHRWSVTP
jgi:hypothetical protein